MAMPRPSGKAKRLAERVVPGMGKIRVHKVNSSPNFLSEVEEKQTKLIEDRSSVIDLQKDRY